MSKKLLSTLLISLLVGGILSAKELCSSSEIPWHLKKYETLYKESPRQASLAWFDDARLGMFIHWGVWGKYSSAWAMYHKRIPHDIYRETARTMDASGFDAESIVKLAKATGMRYITFVAKHHDGFSLWDSQATEWDSMDYPMHRDFVKELAEACRKHGIPLMIYYSIGIDWSHPYSLPTNLYKQARPHYLKTPDFYRYRKPEDFEIYRDFCKKQLTELCTKYGPIAGFWFDPLGGVLANPELYRMQEFYDLIHRYQPHALIHFKTGATGTEDILVGERELRSISNFYKDTPKIAKRADQAWNQNFRKKAEIAVCSHRCWEWSPGNRCLPVQQLYQMLELAAKNNANLLLNTGLQSNGAIPEPVNTTFRELGQIIAEKGYPELNKKNYLESRKNAVVVDDTETIPTAR